MHRPPVENKNSKDAALAECQDGRRWAISMKDLMPIAHDGAAHSATRPLQFSLRSLFALTFLAALTLAVVLWIDVFPRAGFLAVLGWTVAFNRT